MKNFFNIRSFMIKNNLFYGAILLAALTFSACGGKNNKSGFDDAPEAVQVITMEMREEMEGFSSNGMSIDRVDIEGQNIVCEITIDESQFGGMSFKTALDMAGIDAQFLADRMKEKYFNMRVATEKGVRRIQTMREYECSILFRFYGSESDDEIEMMLSYEDVPEVSMEDVEAMRAKYAGLPEEIVEVIGEFETMFSAVNQPGIEFAGVTIEDRDIVCTLLLDEEVLGVKSFKKTFIENGATEAALHERLMTTLSEMSGPQMETEFAALHTYEYNIVMRYVGSKSNDMMQARLHHDELP